MLKFLVRRILYGLISLYVIVSLTFFLMHSIPGGPFDLDAMENTNPYYKKQLEERFGLDRPIQEQYIVYLKNLARGELGISIAYSPRDVASIIKMRLPVSFKLGIVSVAFSIVIGSLLGIIAALKQGKWPDYTLKSMTAVGITIPGFVLATMLIYFFGVRHQLLPFTGLRTPQNYILPVFALSLGPIAYLTRLMRSSLLDVVRQDYIRTSKAKGLSGAVVIYKHALKNALLPVVTFIGPLVTGSLVGSFVIERIFVIPGIGREMVLAIGNRDYTMILGLTFFYSLILITTFIIVDILYALIDPRINYDD